MTHRTPFAHRLLAGLMLFSCLAATACAQPATQPAAKVDFAALVKAYRDLGLPLPPADAPLMALKQDYHSRDDGIPRTIQLGFQLPGKPGDKSLLLLIGTEPVRIAPADDSATPIQPQDVKMADVEPRLWCTFSLNAGLATAIQCKIRGWDSLADALLEKSLAVAPLQLMTLSIYNSDSEEPLPAMQALAYLAWGHEGNALATPGADRAAIARQIRALFARFPELKNDDGLAVLASLEKALKPSHAKPGSVDAMIDDLLDIDTDPMHVQCCDQSVDARGKILLRGFDAVPALIAHIDDDRLSSGVDYGQGNEPSLNSRVGNFVCGILENLAPQQEVGKHWVDPERGWFADKAVVKAWWKKASAMGEEAYVLEHVLPPVGEKNAREPNDDMLNIIAARYPGHLIELYQTVLKDRADLASASLAQHIADSSLPREQKRAAFLSAAAEKTFEPRLPALQQLSRVDPASFVPLYVKTLDELPPTPAGPYWDCDESRFGWLTTLTADDRAWSALKRTAARVDVGLRLEMLQPLSYSCCGPTRHPRQTIQLLAGFLNDTEVRDVKSDPTRYEGPYAGGRFPRLAVRDFAAMSIAAHLKTKVDGVPDKNWTPEQWTAYRDRVTTEMKHELANEESAGGQK